jgi:hypothetical protein
MSPLPQYQLTINSITNVMLSISHYKHPYVTPPTISVTNQFHYKFYAVHLTLYTSLCHHSHTISYQSIPLQILCCPSHTINTLCHPSHTISYQSIPLQMLCCPSHIINILMSPLPHYQLLFNSITNVMLSISHYKHPYVTPPTLSVTNQFHY